MPLITVTTTARWQEPGSVVFRLCKALPRLLIERRKELHLDPDTPLEGVQVRLEQFGPHDINVPEIGVMTVFTEAAPRSRLVREEIRQDIEEIIIDFLKPELLADIPDLDVDVFWGPGAGFMIRRGSVALRW